MNKKAISEIIAYVLLILIAISLSILIYGWMKSYIPKQDKTCEDNLAISIEKINCNSSLNIVNVSLKNRGLFSIDGVILRAGNISEGKAIYLLSNETYFKKLSVNEKLAPAESAILSYNYTKINQIKIIEVQPFIFDKKIILCDNAIVEQKVEVCQ